MKCKRCHTEMKDGVVMTQTFSNEIDLPGRGTVVVSMSPAGPGKVMNCWKCPDCGHSVTKGPATLHPLDAFASPAG